MLISTKKNAKILSQMNTQHRLLDVLGKDKANWLQLMRWEV